jgi:8-oxo-dGTP pyrophosphatase MutT (NUDIX family)
MAFDDTYRLSAHAVITNAVGEVLLLKANYGAFGWGLPGGALEPGETIHDAIARECVEELGCDVEVGPLTGVYYHAAYRSQAFIFRCSLPVSANIVLSEEHSEWRYAPLAALSAVQRRRVEECLSFDGMVKSAAF